MNTVTVDCRQLKGEIKVPASKSILHRYLVCSYVDGEYDNIRNIEQIAGPLSDDVKATRDCLVELIDHADEDPVLNCRESGTTLRFMTALTTAYGIRCTLVAEGSLVGRPMQPFIDELNRHGAKITSERSADTEKYLIEGQLESGNYELPGNISSQFISGLMLATQDLDGEYWIIFDDDIQSMPYVKMTEKIINAFSRGEREELLEGDWSAGAMWVTVNDILGGTLKINGLSADSLQGDKVIINILNEYAIEELMSQETGEKGKLTFDVSNCPDIAAAIALRASVSCLRTEITNAGRLRIKESNRLEAITDILFELGADIVIGEDGESLIINGDLQSAVEPEMKHLRGTDDIIDTRGDHRMVMLAALASAVCDKPVRIDDMKSVAKSYPDFEQDICILGGKIEK